MSDSHRRLFIRGGFVEATLAETVATVDPDRVGLGRASSWSAIDIRMDGVPGAAADAEATS